MPRTAQSRWSVYCKQCLVAFTVEPETSVHDKVKNALSLSCPYCGKTETYSVKDIIQASKAEAG